LLQTRPDLVTEGRESGVIVVTLALILHRSKR
jgi:hypothetical protein